MTTATDRAIDLLICAYGITYTPDEARKIILELAEAIRVEQLELPGRRIRSQRVKLRMTQGELGAAAGLSIGMICNIEYGRNRAAPHLAKIAEALGVTVGWLKGDE